MSLSTSYYTGYIYKMQRAQFNKINSQVGLVVEAVVGSDGDRRLGGGDNDGGGEFHDTLIQHLESVKKSIDERAQHKREYDNWVNEKQMQTTKEKVDTSKALDASLVDTESSGTESKEQDTSNRSRNDAHDDDDADIRPIYDEEPMVEKKDAQSYNTTKRYIPVEKKANFKNHGRQIPIGEKLFSNKSPNMYLKTTPPRSSLTWKPTGRIFSQVGVKWIPIGKSVETCNNTNDSVSPLRKKTHNPNTTICANSSSLSTVKIRVSSSLGVFKLRWLLVLLGLDMVPWYLCCWCFSTVHSWIKSSNLISFLERELYGGDSGDKNGDYSGRSYSNIGIDVNDPLYLHSSDTNGTPLIDHAKLLKLMQFMMRLNDVYAPIRSTLLTTEHLPTVKEAFSLLLRDESHRNMHFGNSKVNARSSVFVSRYDNKGSPTSFVSRPADNKRRKTGRYSPFGLVNSSRQLPNGLRRSPNKESSYRENPLYPFQSLSSKEKGLASFLHWGDSTFKMKDQLFEGKSSSVKLQLYWHRLCLSSVLQHNIGFKLTAFSYSDHACCLDSRKSTSGGIQFLGGDKLVSWSFKKQDCTSMSSIEAEYHIIKEQVKKGIVELFFVGTEYQLADLFTKALPEDRFKYLVRRLGMRSLTPEELEVLANESA
uniref:Uncharacterized mitochondrial protein AtMg00810-like n=1 Tax=Tanacetum cinerariifolium TaxID=118510 RepID=A0A6L2J7U0_TANCI|nr:uncharacterized mitochondrial protein AtMg00810-like [Tanacetum cinerariifolium]